MPDFSFSSFIGNGNGNRFRMNIQSDEFYGRIFFHGVSPLFNWLICSGGTFQLNRRRAFLATCQTLCLSIYSRESFLNYQDVQWTSMISKVKGKTEISPNL